jgi:hypothetical protein
MWPSIHHLPIISQQRCLRCWRGLVGRQIALEGFDFGPVTGVHSRSVPIYGVCHRFAGQGTAVAIDGRLGRGRNGRFVADRCGLCLLRPLAVGGRGHPLRFLPLETDINGRCRLTGRYDRAGCGPALPGVARPKSRHPAARPPAARSLHECDNA